MRVSAENITQRYFRKTGEANFFEAVRQTNLTLEPGKVTVLMGRSGSGKTTLLHILAGLLTPSEGKVILSREPGEKAQFCPGDNGSEHAVDLYSLDDRKLSWLRNEHIAVIPQARSAVETLTVRENVLLPAMLYGKSDARSAASAEEWMEKLGILPLADSYPKELSGGELRRMAIARALWRKPAVVLADEPTGDLDDENTALAFRLLREAAEQNNTAVLLVTHESEALKYADEAWRMDAGALSRMEDKE